DSVGRLQRKAWGKLRLLQIVAVIPANLLLLCVLSLPLAGLFLSYNCADFGDRHRFFWGFFRSFR
ncbi:hypothetical protein, partial [Synechocystis salina]|uniref:hypothetical protein n=1 Tax=Synechocystis salina TaxID=945780 RepID=UPI001D14D8A3